MVYTIWNIFLENIYLHKLNLCMVAYFCHHLSDNNVDLSDLYFVLSDHLCWLVRFLCWLVTCHLLENKSFKKRVLAQIMPHRYQQNYRTSQHKDLTSQHHYLTRQHNYLTSRHNIWQDDKIVWKVDFSVIMSTYHKFMSTCQILNWHVNGT